MMAVLCRLILLTIPLCVTTSAQVQGTCGENGAVRLVYDGSMARGRLEICVNGQWGSVCNDGPPNGDAEFDIDAARIVCRQLGFPGVENVITNIFFGGAASSQPTYLDDVQCDGTEPSLLNCSYVGTGTGVQHDCGPNHEEDVGIICEQSRDCRDGSVRLVDGDNYNATAGRVEYCAGGLWGTVCGHDDNGNNAWGEVDALVVCRQLGLNTFVTDLRVLTSIPQVKDLSTPIVLKGLNCRSHEATLGECGRAPIVEYCTHSDDVGANCTVIVECNDGDIRLVQLDGDAENEGRVEYCRGGRWGLVCSESWDTNDAKVICRQLGYDVENKSVLATDRRTERTRPPSHLQKVNCVGTEEIINECPRDDTHVCHNLAAGVVCPNARPPPTVQTFCSVVVWSNPRFPCDDIIGSEVRLYDPDSGKEVSHSVDSYSTYYIITDEDKLKIESEKAYVQVRVLHKLVGARKWSDGIPLGCEIPKPKGIHFVHQDKVYLNNSAISLQLIGENENALLCKTDREDCCGMVPNRFGEFYYPSGVQVPIKSRGHGFYRNRGKQEIRLHRRPGVATPTGRFHCQIPDARGALQSIYIEVV